MEENRRMPNELKNFNNFLLELNDNELPDFDEFRSFSMYKKRDRLTFYTNPLLILKTHIRKTLKGYVFKKDDKKYYFEEIGTKANKKDIKKRRDGKNTFVDNINMALRIVGSNYLGDPYYVLAKCKTNHRLASLVDYSKNGKRYIVDFEYDIIMEKDKYYELFDVEEVTRLDQVQVYKEWLELDRIEFLINPGFMTLLFDEYEKTISYRYDDKNMGGIHKNNFHMFGQDSDVEFRHLTSDDYNQAYIDISKFTIDPTQKIKGVRKGKDCYKYKGYKFRLLSDTIASEDIKAKLLSNNRYGHCHVDAISLLCSLSKLDNADDLHIVSGYNDHGEKDRLLHTWVELGNTVLDYSHNLIMRRKNYYKIFGTHVVEDLTLDEFKYVSDRVDEVMPEVSARIVEFFGHELTRDFKRNEFLFENMEKKR